MPKVTPEYIENKKKMIVESAYRVCLKKPVETVTISDVIAETGMSMGAIYRYFSGLDEILVHMVREMRKEYDSYDRIIALSKEEGLTFEEIIYKAFDILGDVMEKHLMDIQKINFDFGVLAINNPERMKKIMNEIAERGTLENLGQYIFPKMIEAVEKQGFQAHISNEELVLFISTAFTGIEKNCILSACYGSGIPGVTIEPKPLFRTLAKSVILLMGGSVNE